MQRMRTLAGEDREEGGLACLRLVFGGVSSDRCDMVMAAAVAVAAVANLCQWVTMERERGDIK